MRTQKMLKIGCVLLIFLIGIISYHKFSKPRAGVSFLGWHVLPAPGYELVRGELVWCPGLVHSGNQHLVAGSVENSWRCKDGYAFVEPGSLQTRWVPGMIVGSADYMIADKMQDRYLLRVNCSACNGTGERARECCAACDHSGRIKVMVECPYCFGCGSHFCSKCGGTGIEKGRSGACSLCKNQGKSVQCTKCSGTGKFEMVETCRDCDGNGYAFCRPCADCKGRGFLLKGGFTIQDGKPQHGDD